IRRRSSKNQGYKNHTEAPVAPKRPSGVDASLLSEINPPPSLLRGRWLAQRTSGTSAHFVHPPARYRNRRHHVHSLYWYRSIPNLLAAHRLIVALARPPGDESRH